MSKVSGSPTSSTLNNKVGPDLFGFYTSEVAELLSKDFQLESGLPKNTATKENNGIKSSTPLFSNGIGALVSSEFKKERLKSLLRQSVFTLTKEVDEMIDPVLSICQIRSRLKCKGRLLRLDASSCKADKPHQPLKKLKRGCSNHLTNGPIKNSDAQDVEESVEIDDDMRLLLESDTTMVEELMKNYSNEFAAKLNHMEQKLEELLNISMTSCRQMTLVEKQHLRKLIQNLSPNNLDRVTEIIGQDKNFSCSEVHVDLAEMGQCNSMEIAFLHFHHPVEEARKMMNTRRSPKSESTKSGFKGMAKSACSGALKL
ncbi:hypothetical protein CASFOL_033106 [Castilleja foliolosa]|uniref:NET domain-containing protein n=1 Tax=Castilleja foliolosa TaxID=1961234 RepID=A0ABD3C3F0_9LAMI